MEEKKAKKAYQYVAWNELATAEPFGIHHYGDGIGLATSEAVSVEAGGIVEVKIDKGAPYPDVLMALQKIESQYLQELEEQEGAGPRC